MKTKLTKIVLLFAISLLFISCSTILEPTTCSTGLKPLNAKISDTSNGGFSAELSSEHGTIKGVPIKVNAGYKISSEQITQCVLASFADLLVKRPELFNIEIDGQGKFKVNSKKN